MLLLVHAKTFHSFIGVERILPYEKLKCSRWVTIFPEEHHKYDIAIVVKYKIYGSILIAFFTAEKVEKPFNFF